MEILLWLVPPAAVTALAMCWVAWAGRAERERSDRVARADRDVATERMQRALERRQPRRYAAPTPERDRSTGVAVRPSRRAS